MTTTSIRLFDEGTIIRVGIGVDVSTATTRKILYKKPDRSYGEWAASLYDTNYIQYITLENDIDQTGLWKIQSYIETSSGKWYGDPDSFHVTARLIAAI